MLLASNCFYCNSLHSTHLECKFLDVVCIYAMEYYSTIKRNKIGAFVMMWMKLESVIQSEESQKEKNVYYISIHIYGNFFKKMYICGAGSRCRTNLWTREGRKVGQTETVALTYTQCAVQCLVAHSRSVVSDSLRPYGL